MPDRPNHRQVAAIDLFCGVGGMTHGFILEGIPVVAGIDSDPSVRYAYRTNNDSKFVNADIVNVSGKYLSDFFPEKALRVLIGCAPCQPFSRYTRRKGDAPSWGLLREYGRLVEELRPEIISMENVPELATRKKYPIYSEFVQHMKNLGYSDFEKIVDCTEYGVPQTRKRLVYLGSRLGEIALIHPESADGAKVTVKTAIGHLPPLKAGEADTEDPLHRASGLSDLNLQRIRHSKPGGSWRDWPRELRAPCHRRKTGKSYPSVYGRMSWDKPSPTITTQAHGFGNGRFGHPEQDRAISLREMAILQSFPGDYRFLEPDKPLFVSTTARHIGNAVPVELGKAVARSIKAHLEEVYAG